MSRCTAFWPAFAVALVLPCFARSQEIEFPKPGPEHAHLKSLEGMWDAEMIMADGAKSKGVATYKMECGGLWLASDYQGEFGGQKFAGRGLDSYDLKKKKYVGVWVDSMVTRPMFVEGDRDDKTNTTTLTGDSPEGGPDGKPLKVKLVTKMPDADHMNFEFFMVGPDGKDTSAFKINYTRRKK